MTIRINDKAAKAIWYLALTLVLAWTMLQIKNEITNYITTNFTAPFLANSPTAPKGLATGLTINKLR
jgi:hypothetical protein